MTLEIPSIEKVPEKLPVVSPEIEASEKPPEPLTEDELLEGIAGGIYNKKDKDDKDDAETIAAIARANMTFETCPQLLLSEKIEKAVGLRLQYLIGNSQAQTNNNEMAFLDELFRRIQKARRQASS